MIGWVSKEQQTCVHAQGKLTGGVMQPCASACLQGCQPGGLTCVQQTSMPPSLTRVCSSEGDRGALTCLACDCIHSPAVWADSP
jgi:hypothetical protein